MQSCYQERIIYFWRHELYGHARLLCEIGIQEKQNNLILFLWHGLSLAKLGLIPESKNEIGRLESRKDLIIIYKTAQYFIAKEERDEKLNEKYQELINVLNDKNSFSSCNAAQIAWLFGDIHLAEKILSYLTPTVFSKTINGWILFSRGKYDDALKQFLDILSDPTHSYDLLPLYGKATCLCAINHNAEAFQVQSQIISRYKFPEVLLDKARLHQKTHNWDLSLNILSEVKDEMICLYEYYELQAIVAIVSKDNYPLAEESVVNLVDIASKIENYNYHILQKTALLIATLCTTNYQLVDKALKLAKIAGENERCDSMSLAVLGYYQLLAQNYVLAIPSLQKSIEKSPMNKFASEKLIEVMIEIGRHSEAQDQLDMLEITGGSSLDIFLLQTKLVRIRDHKRINIDFLLTELEKRVVSEAIDDELFGDEKGWEHPYELAHKQLISLRLDTISGILDELIFYNKGLTKSSPDDYINRLFEVFNKLDKIAPMFQPFKFLRGLLLMRVGKIDESLTIFQRLLLSPWVYRLQYCLLYISNCLLENDDPDEARGYLKEALQNDPTLINSMDYAFINAKLNANRESPKSDLEKVIPYFDREKRSVIEYSDFFDICFDLGEYGIPAKLLKKAGEAAVTSYEKALVLTKQATILGARKQFAKAEQVLNKLKNSNKYTYLGYSTEAHIRLTFQGDRKGYVQSFIDLLQYERTPKHMELLGDAYANVHDYDKAASCYSSTLDLKTPDVSLLKKLVSSLVDAHRFDDAANFLTRSVNFLKGNVAVPLHLIKVLITLKRFKEAKLCIDSTYRLVMPTQTVIYAEILEQRGIVYSKLGEKEEADKCFQQSLEKYESVLSEGNTTKYAVHLKHSASNVCVKLGENIEPSNRDKALQYYQKGLQIDDTNYTTITKIFNTYKSRNDQTRCVEVCRQYLERYPKNETVVLLYTSAESRDYPKAIKYLEDILDERPKSYRLLVRYVEVCARAGALQSIKLRLQKYESDTSPAISFVRGLKHVYFSEIPAAIEEFKKSVQSNHWRLQSQAMLFTCLVNPNKKFLWLESEPLSPPENLEEAAKLLSKMQITPNERKLYNAMLLAAQNTDDSVSRACELANSVYHEERINLAAITAAARYLTRLKKDDEAQRLLNIIVSGVAFHDNASFFEEAYLMKAWFARNSTNPRQSHQYIFLALDLNKSCKYAWQMNGEVYLKNKLYSEAISPFQRVWELSGEQDIESGYNLALCALHSHKPELALSVCHRIMEFNPVYKDLKETILIPAFKLIY